MQQLLGRWLSVPLLVIMVMTLVMAGACKNPTEEPGLPTGFEITDDLGKRLSFDGPVNTIVSLAPSDTEIVFAVGAGDKLVGRTDYCDFPPEVTSKDAKTGEYRFPIVGGFETPNKETIIALSPDVVLAADIHLQNGDTAWLEEKGLRVVTLTPKTLGDVLQDITGVGKLTGKEAEATQLVGNMQNRIEYVAGRTTGLSDDQQPRVLHITWHAPLWTAGEGTFTDALIEMAGGVNVFSDVTGDIEVSLETAVVRNPKVITVFTSHGAAGNTSYEYVIASDSPFRTTDAYLSGRIYLIDADIASRGGPRIVEALETYARFLHPEIFDSG